MSSELVRYRFRDCLAGFFEFPTENARRILPPELQPIEPHHGSSVLSVMAFDFHESLVGAYQELILGVLVAPRVEPGVPMPRSAFYPILLGTTTQSAREHAIERWHLPHYMADIQLEIHRGAGEATLHASERGAPILEMTITDHEWSPVEHRYQAFMHDNEGAFMATIVMQADFSENEEERGSLALHAHAMTAELDHEDVATMPFREQWMRNGLQTFHPLQPLAIPARR